VHFSERAREYFAENNAAFSFNPSWKTAKCSAGDLPRRINMEANKQVDSFCKIKD